MTKNRSGESGIAMIIVMFMVLAVSLIGSSLMFVSRTETLSSMSYQTVSQVRYAAESGIHSAANQILWNYTAPTTGGADPIGAYNLATSPVQWNGAAVVLSSDPAVAQNYPVAAVRNAFSAATQGALNVGVGSVNYVASATLMSMRQITDAYTGAPVTLQTWQITGTGSVPGAGSAQVPLTATLEHEDKPAFQFAAFSTNNGCDSLHFGGGAHTDSYDSSTYGGAGVPATTASGGNVGTNGNLDQIGNTTSIAGSLSTPRSGVGACSANNVTALTGDLSAVTGGITQLSQPITYPTPPAPTLALPPGTSDDFQKNNGCPAGVLFCTPQAGVGATIHPATAATVISLGDVSLTGGATLHLSAGVYDVNSISMTGNSTIIIDGPGPVIFQVAGKNADGSWMATPLDLTGGGVSNLTYNPQALQFVYAGTGQVKMAGGSSAAATLFAPNASVSMTGGADFYGAIIAGMISDLGGAAIHYDRNLQKAGTTDGNPILDQFTWKNY